MTAEPGSKSLLARSQGWDFGFAQRKQANVIVGLRPNYYSARLKSDLGFPRYRRFRLANTGAAAQPDHAPGAGPSIKLARIAQTVRCGDIPRYRGPNHFGIQTKLGNNAAIRLGRKKQGR